MAGGDLLGFVNGFWGIGELGYGRGDYDAGSWLGDG